MSNNRNTHVNKITLKHKVVSLDCRKQEYKGQERENRIKLEGYGTCWINFLLVFFFFGYSMDRKSLSNLIWISEAFYISHKIDKETAQLGL